jgi:hypothetical protein
MIDDIALSRFREFLPGIADKIIQHEDMARHPRNTEDFKKGAQKDADEDFLEYTRLIVHAVENLHRRLKVLEAKNRP